MIKYIFPQNTLKLYLYFVFIFKKYIVPIDIDTICIYYSCLVNNSFDNFSW